MSKINKFKDHQFFNIIITFLFLLFFSFVSSTSASIVKNMKVLNMVGEKLLVKLLIKSNDENISIKIGSRKDFNRMNILPPDFLDSLHIHIVSPFDLSEGKTSVVYILSKDWIEVPRFTLLLKIFIPGKKPSFEKINILLPFSKIKKKRIRRKQKKINQKPYKQKQKKVIKVKTPKIKKSLPKVTYKPIIEKKILKDEIPIEIEEVEVEEIEEENIYYKKMEDISTEPSIGYSYFDYKEEFNNFRINEIMVSAFISLNGVTELPPNDKTKDNFELSDRYPGNYISFKYSKTSAPFFNFFSIGLFQLNKIHLNPRFVYNILEKEQTLGAIDFAPKDFWFRYKIGENNKLILKVGQIIIPYGVNPDFAPRRSFILPLEITDLGIKWDWGFNLKGPFNKYIWETALTIGSGEGIHNPFGQIGHTAYLLTGRIGSSSKKKLTNGISFLFGNSPVINSSIILSKVTLSRYRIGYDVFYKHTSHLSAAVQITYGGDGFRGDKKFVRISNGNGATVFSMRAWAGMVLPRYKKITISSQYESVIRDTATNDTTDSALILQIKYPFSKRKVINISFRGELSRIASEKDKKDNRLYISYNYFFKK